MDEKEHITSIRFERPLYKKILEQSKKEHRNFSEMVRYMCHVYIREQEVKVSKEERSR